MIKFFLMTILIIQGISCFHTNSRFIYSRSGKNAVHTFI